MTTETVTLHLPAIHCDGCLGAVRRTLEGAGAEFESGDVQSKRVTVRFDSDRLSRAAVVVALERSGFPPEAEE